MNNTSVFLYRFFVAVSIALLLSGSLAADELTAKEKKAVKSIGKTIDRAGRLFKTKKYASAAEKIAQAQEKLLRLAKDADKELLAIIAPEYQRLSTAHELLIKNGQKLDKLPPLPEPLVSETTENVSFKSQVAAVLVNNCGNCHVRQARGDFSAANYSALMDSTHVATGKPDESRIVEVIVDGEMPPGNRKVSKDDLNILQQWIAQGAKFDGIDPTANLNSLGSDTSRNSDSMAVAKPTGSESVSFGTDVAPVLIEKCGSCHIDRDRPQGNFSMATFRRLIRGGDGGAPIAAGDANKSGLIARLRGDGVRVMPPRDKLDEKTIAMFETWINEGAKFDGDDARKPVKTIAAIAKANAQTHEQLFDDRIALAKKNWKLVMSEDVQSVVTTKNFRIVGNAGENCLQTIQSMLEDLTTKSSNELKLNADEPLVKGGLTFFVFERRYDFNELGVMVVGHELPKEINSYWQSETVDAFGALLLTKNKEPGTAKLDLAVQLGSLYAASLAPDTPRWFSDGFGRYLAARLLPRDESVKSWDSESEQVIAELKNPGDGIDGKLGPKKTALASYQLIRQLKKGELQKLLRQSQKQSSFVGAFEQLYGKTPTEYFRQRNPKRSRPR